MTSAMATLNQFLLPLLLMYKTGDTKDIQSGRFQGSQQHFNGSELGAVIGLFDHKDDIDAFTSAMDRNFTYLRYYALYSVDDHISMMEYLCNITDTLLIYAMTDLASIQMISTVAAWRGVPAFVYDTGPEAGRKDTTVQGEMIYNLNANRKSEGQAISEILATNSWPNVEIMVRSDLQFDGFLDSFISTYSSDQLAALNTTVFKQEDSIRDLLIQIENLISSRQHQQSQTSEVIILHCQTDTAGLVLAAADLVFHRHRIMWLLSTEACSDESGLSDIRSDIVCLEAAKADSSFIIDSLNFILSKIGDQAERSEEIGLARSKSCGNSTFDTQRLNSWKQLLDQTGITINGEVNIYKYDMKVPSKANNTVQWSKIGCVRSISDSNIPTMREFLSVMQRKMYTVVSAMDRPFAQDSAPIEYDGGEYCSTPSIPCLKMPQSIIVDHDFSSGIIRQVFEDYYTGTKVITRPYEKRCCQGLVIDVLKSLASELNFEYQLYIVPDRQFGAYDPDVGNWSGLVKELIDGRADIVMAGFSIISPRAAVIEYSSPYYHSGFSLMTIMRQDTDTKWFSYLKPFPNEVWGLIFAASVVAFLCLACFEWFSPYGLNPSHDSSKSSYTISSAIKTIYSLLAANSVSTKMTVCWSGIFFQSVWGLFAIIFLAAYTANLTSAIAESRSVYFFENIYDEKLLELRVAASTNSAAEQYIKLILPALYKNMRNFKIVRISEAVAELEADNLDVWIDDTPIIDYAVSKENGDCSLRKLLSFSTDSYGIGFPKNKHEDIRSALDSKLLEYQDSGYIERLHKIYFSSGPVCLDGGAAADQIQLTLQDAAGMFLTLVGFIAFCSATVLIEHFLYRFLIPYAKKKPTGSIWRGKLLMFFSQRIHRGIEKDGESGGVVFKEFANLFRKARQSLKPPKKIRMTFYEAVEEIYWRERRKPLSMILLTKKKVESTPSVLEGLRQSAMLQSGFPIGINSAMYTSQAAGMSKLQDVPGRSSEASLNGRCRRAGSEDSFGGQ